VSSLASATGTVTFSAERTGARRRPARSLAITFGGRASSRLRHTEVASRATGRWRNLSVWHPGRVCGVACSDRAKACLA
jgi:hypothetical protein